MKILLCTFFLILNCFAFATSSDVKILHTKEHSNVSILHTKELKSTYTYLDCEDAKINQVSLEAAYGCKFSSDLAWAEGKIRFKISNTFTFPQDIAVTFDKFLIGYKLYVAENECFFIEVGHVKLDNIFRSKIQFKSYLDGYQLNYKCRNFNVHAAHNIVDAINNHHSFIGEASLSSIANLPISLYYSIADWYEENYFINSQVSAYLDIESVLKFPFEFYAGFIKNHKLQDQCKAHYIGVEFGIPNKAWTFDVNYQYAGFYAIPYYDNNGLGQGVYIKSHININDNFSVQAKVNVSDYKLIELSGSYKW